MHILIHHSMSDAAIYLGLKREQRKLCAACTGIIIYCVNDIKFVRTATTFAKSVFHFSTQAIAQYPRGCGINGMIDVRTEIKHQIRLMKMHERGPLPSKQVVAKLHVGFRVFLSHTSRHSMGLRVNPRMVV